MSLLKLTSMACLALTLGACQSLFQPNMHAPLDVKRDAWEHAKPGCIGQDCPLVNIDMIHFPSEPDLDPIVEQRLLQLTRPEPGTPLPASLKAYEDQYLRQAPNHNASYLQAKVREQHDGLVVIELSSYLDSGEAQGVPGRGFINYSRQQHKVLSLQDMLVPGQEATFWKTAEEAHRGWMVNEKLDQDAEFVKAWPFKQTPHIALTSGAVILKYDVKTITPYDKGHIELKIPYARLNGVIKPQLVPGRG
jgi:hypothetical protein